VARHVWHWRWLFVAPIAGVILFVDFLLASSNLYK
jgi:K+ transporter